MGSAGLYPANMRRWPNVGVLLAHRLRRWPNSKPTSLGSTPILRKQLRSLVTLNKQCLSEDPDSMVSRLANPNKTNKQIKQDGSVPYSS